MTNKYDMDFLKAKEKLGDTCEQLCFITQTTKNRFNKLKSRLSREEFTSETRKKYSDIICTDIYKTHINLIYFTEAFISDMENEDIKLPPECVAVFRQMIDILNPRLQERQINSGTSSSKTMNELDEKGTCDSGTSTEPKQHVSIGVQTKTNSIFDVVNQLKKRKCCDSSTNTEPNQSVSIAVQTKPSTTDLFGDHASYTLNKETNHHNLSVIDKVDEPVLDKTICPSVPFRGSSPDCSSDETRSIIFTLDDDIELPTVLDKTISSYVPFRGSSPDCSSNETRSIIFTVDDDIELSTEIGPTLKPEDIKTEDIDEDESTIPLEGDQNCDFTDFSGVLDIFNKSDIIRNTAREDNDQNCDTDDFAKATQNLYLPTGTETRDHLNDVAEASHQESTRDDVSKIQEGNITDDVSNLQEETITEDVSVFQKDNITENVTRIQDENLTDDVSILQEENITDDVTKIQDKNITDNSILQEENITDDVNKIQDENITDDVTKIQDKNITDNSILQEENITDDVSNPQEENVTDDVSILQKDNITDNVTKVQDKNITDDNFETKDTSPKELDSREDYHQAYLNLLEDDAHMSDFSSCSSTSLISQLEADESDHSKRDTRHSKKATDNQIPNSVTHVLYKECYVRIERLSEKVLQSLNKHKPQKPVHKESSTSSSSEIDEDAREEREIARLTNLKSLKKRRRISSSSSGSRDVRQRPKKKHLRKHSSDEAFTSSSRSGSTSSTDAIDDTDDPSSITMRSVSPVVSDTDRRSDGYDNDIAILEGLKGLSDESTSDKDTDSDHGREEDDVKEKIKKQKQKSPTKDEDRKRNVKQSKWRNDPLLKEKLNSSDSDSSLIVKPKRRRKKNSGFTSDSTNDSKEDVIADSDKDIKVKQEDNDPSQNPMDSIKAQLNNTVVYDTTSIVPDVSDSSSDIEFIMSPTKKKSKGTIYIGDTNSDDSDLDDNSPKKGRKNIRAVLDDVSLEEATKIANKEEEERRERISQKHKSLENILSQTSIEEEGLILDVDNETEITVTVDPKLSSRLKPHQQKGVLFMWDACYESVRQLKESKGSGCILAHCMGLGKTFQVVALIHTLFSYSITNTKHVLVVCPLSTVLNWVHEFDLGLKHVSNKVNVFHLSERKVLTERHSIIKKWWRKGGVMIVGYEAYERLTKDNENAVQKEIKEALVDPGPDLIVCDEGHLLKNGKTFRTKALMKIKTLRRIVLTGTPMQNNLKEYYYMVQFVKPNLLGTFQEFSNRFINPITNGQYDDSTEYDINLMKKRSHVLHKILKGTVQRYEATELLRYLPDKFDHVLFIKISPLQTVLYKRYVEGISASDTAGKFFTHCRQLRSICTHPYVLHLEDIARAKVKKGKTKEMDVIVLEPEIKDNEPLPSGWWQSLCPEDYDTNIEYGPKFQIMLAIIEESEKVGDKVLVFSNSIPELDAIEYFLQRSGLNKTWKKNKDYYRLDGNVIPEIRMNLCNSFNKSNNARVFLMSHKVGGLGLNLISANRVILMDVNWNPSYESQSIFRTYRFGQTKACYVYRLVAIGTMEEVLYERSVTKLAIAGRVVDERQITRHYKSTDLQEMYRLKLNENDVRPAQKPPSDEVLANLLQTHPHIIFKYHEHQALLENRPDEELNEEEMKLAWEEFNKEKEQRRTLPVQAPQPGQFKIFSTAIPGMTNANHKIVDTSINYCVNSSAKGYNTFNPQNAAASVASRVQRYMPNKRLNFQSGHQVQRINQDPQLIQMSSGRPAVNNKGQGTVINSTDSYNDLFVVPKIVRIVGGVQSDFSRIIKKKVSRKTDESMPQNENRVFPYDGRTPTPLTELLRDQPSREEVRPINLSKETMESLIENEIVNNLSMNGVTITTKPSSQGNAADETNKQVPELCLEIVDNNKDGVIEID